MNFQLLFRVLFDELRYLLASSYFTLKDSGSFEKELRYSLPFFTGNVVLRASLIRQSALFSLFLQKTKDDSRLLLYGSNCHRFLNI